MTENPQKKHILVVEDDASTTHLLQLVLESNGYEATILANGRDALQFLEKKIPDLIISDVCMPEMDGFTFLKEMKKNPSASQIPVMILTARKNMEDTFLVLGVDEFLIKPFSTEELLARILRLISRGKSSSSAAGSITQPLLGSKKVNKPYLSMLAIGAFLLLVIFAVIGLIRGLIGGADSRKALFDKNGANVIEGEINLNDF